MLFHIYIYLSILCLIFVTLPKIFKAIKKRFKNTKDTEDIKLENLTFIQGITILITLNSISNLILFLIENNTNILKVIKLIFTFRLLSITTPKICLMIINASTIIFTTFLVKWWKNKTNILYFAIAIVSFIFDFVVATNFAIYMHNK